MKYLRFRILPETAGIMLDTGITGPGYSQSTISRIVPKFSIPENGLPIHR
jgi:hypothetical protein